VIANFPDPYEDELLFSVIARYTERMNYPARYTGCLELFGVRHGVLAIELPNRIDQLVTSLPPTAVYTADALIQKHTMFPLYAPFLPQRSRELIFENMKGQGVRTTQLRSGIAAGRVKPPEFFRTCPACDEENISRYGETYWRRAFQIRGVEVCARHGIFLEETNIQQQGGWKSLVTAQSARRVCMARRIDRAKAEEHLLLNLAESIVWLLEKNTAAPGLSEINLGYRRLLQANNFVTAKGHIRLNLLRQKFAETCSAEKLKQFGCELYDGGDGGWLGRLLREKEQGVAPLRHLLVMAMLGVSAEEFFGRLSVKAGEISDQPRFPCLNLVCPQFRKNVISGFETKSERKGPAHMFACPECGHISSRSTDGLAILRVVKFGDLWEQHLKTGWDDESQSLRKVADELGADSRSLLRCALKLKLKFPRRGPTRLTAIPRYIRFTKRVSADSARDGKRAAWVRLRNSHPNAGISELHRLNSALYTWLYRHDRYWLNLNSPVHREIKPQNNRVDWRARDKELVDKVIAAAIRIKNEPKCSRRVTVRSIGIELGVQTLLQIHKDKLPRTKEALETHVESSEQFALRRIKYATSSLKVGGGLMTKSAIERCTNLGEKARQMPAVQRAIAKALNDSEKSPFFTPKMKPETAEVLAA
jgi:hypothetical protein